MLSPRVPTKTRPSLGVERDPSLGQDPVSTLQCPDVKVVLVGVNSIFFFYFSLSEDKGTHFFLLGQMDTLHDGWVIVGGRR